MNKFGFIILCLSVVGVLSEAPRYRQQQQQQQQQRFQQQRGGNSRFFQRQEVETTTNNDQSNGAPYAAAGYQPARAFDLPTEQKSKQEGTTEAETQTEDSSTVSAPYPPSGVESSARLFRLPARQQVEPKNTYGAPAQAYGPPATEYGAPEETSTEGSGDEDTTEEAESEPIDIDIQAEALSSNEISKQQRLQQQQQQQQQRGAYFVQLPDGSLQRIAYLSSADLANMEVSARLQVRPVQTSLPLVYNPVLSPQFLSYTSQYQNW